LIPLPYHKMDVAAMWPLASHFLCCGLACCQGAKNRVIIETLVDWLGVGGRFLVILIGAAGWGRAGLCLLRCLLGRSQNPKRLSLGMAEGWYLSLVLGMGLLSWLTLFLGLGGMLYPVAVWGLAAVGAGAGLILNHLVRPEVNVGSMENKETQNNWPQRVLQIILILVGIGSLLYTLITNALMPPHEWDEISYHMALAKTYVDSHKIVYVPFIVHSNWPMNTEMLFCLGLLLDSDIVAHLITWWITLWSAWGLYLTGKRFLDRRVGWLAATLYLTIPLVERLAGTGLIDVSLAFYGTGVILTHAH
jgi:hypothetical protein